jgi:DNA polymerase-3 subunit beta
MNFTCDRGALVAQLAVLSRGVSARSALPVLSGILLQVAGGRLDLFATDMEISIKATLTVDSEQTGDVVVPARLFADVVRNLPGEVVRVSTAGDGGMVHVEAGKAQFSLNAWVASDFPQTSAFDLSGGFSIAREPFVETLGKVARAASRDETRPILTGVLVALGAGSVKMVATDSYRLSVKQSALEGGPEDEVQAIVPVKALAEVSRLATSSDRPSIDVAITENQALFGFGEVIVATRLIDGVFPNYRQLLPEAYEHELTLDRDEFLGVARRVGLLAQKNAPLRLKFLPADESNPSRLLVRAITQDVGDAHEELAVEYEGEAFEIGFNHAYLIDGLEAVDGERVVLKLISPLRPGLITGADGDFLYLIMPIRLSN